MRTVTYKCDMCGKEHEGMSASRPLKWIEVHDHSFLHHDFCTEKCMMDFFNYKKTVPAVAK